MAIKIKVGGGDSKKKATKVKVTTKASSADVESANKFAKEFALRKGLISGENTHSCFLRLRFGSWPHKNTILKNA